MISMNILTFSLTTKKTHLCIPSNTQRIISSLDLDGIERLLTDCGIESVEDPKATVLLYKLGSCTIDPIMPASIRRKEFVDSMKTMRISKLDDLRVMVPALDPGFMDQEEFRKYYKFYHRFNREGTYSFVVKEDCISLLRSILGGTGRAPHLDHFIRFLEQSSEHEQVTMDPWDSFLLFNMQVGLDLSGYDADTSAWPVMIDDYAEWKQKNP